MIIRNDDVTANTNIFHLAEMYGTIKDFLPKAEIWSCVNLFCRTTPSGSVYPDLPLRQRDMKYFYNVDLLLRDIPAKNFRIVSHGTHHVDHSKLSRDAQEMSILTSCSYLHTDIFVPPFSQFNETTKQVCKANGIRLVMPMDGWKSLESHEFCAGHKLWFFHSWRFTPKEFRKKLEKCMAKMISQ